MKCFLYYQHQPLYYRQGGVTTIPGKARLIQMLQHHSFFFVDILKEYKSLKKPNG